MVTRIYAPTKLTIGAAETEDQYVSLDVSTDRHQLHVHFAATGNALGIAVAAPAKNAGGSFPAAADVPAVDWVPVVASPTDSTRLVLQAHARYVRFDPGAGVGQVVTVGYQPLPASGGVRAWQLLE